MIRSTAIFSEDQKYRYRLDRVWDKAKPLLGFIMLNPSTADAEVNDPTVTRCIKRAQRLGYGGAVVGNAYAYRSTDPKKLRLIGGPIGFDNDSHLLNIMNDCETIIVAWGAHAKLGRAKRICDIAEEAGKQLYCLALTKHGAPRHPLYLKDDLELKEFNI